MSLVQNSRDEDECFFSGRYRFVINITADGHSLPVTTLDITRYSLSTSSKMEKLMEVFKFLIKTVVPVMCSLLQTVTQANSNLNHAPALWIFLTPLLAYTTIHLIAMFGSNNGGNFLYPGASSFAIIAVFSFLSFFIPTHFSFIPAIALSIPVIVAANWDRNWMANSAARKWIQSSQNYLRRFRASPETAPSPSPV